MTSTAKPHGFVTKGLHWVSAAMLAYGYYTGLEDVSELADPTIFQFEIIFALVLGAAFMVRLLWTKGVAGSTRLPQDAPQWEHKASHIVQIGLYASVFGIVLTGLGISLGFSTPMLSGIFLTAMIGLHEIVLTIMPLFLLTHIAGALWHKFIRRDGVMESMTGRIRRVVS